MTARLISRGCLVVLIGVGCAGPATLLRAQGPDVGTDAQRASGKQLYAKILRAVPRREGRRRGLRHAPPLPQAAELHDRQVQGADDAQRRAADASGPRQHHQARHALHLDARLAQPLRPAGVGARLLHQDVLPGFRRQREGPEAGRAAERAERLERDRRAGEEAVRRDGLFAMPRDARAGRRTVGAHAEGRLWASHSRGRSRAELDLPRRLVARGHLPHDEHGVQRDADAGVRRWPHARAALGDHRLHRLAVGERRAALHQPGRRQAGPRPDRREQGRRELRRRSRRPVSDHRADHGAGARVRAAGDVRDACRRSTTPSRLPCSCAGTTAAPRRPGRTARRCPCLPRRRSCRRQRPNRPATAANPFGDAEVAPGGPASRSRIPSPRPTRQPRRPPSSPTPSRSRFRRRCRPARASPTSSSATARARWISGSSISAKAEPLRFTGKGSADVTPNDAGGVTGVASYDQGEWSVIFKRPRRPDAGAAFAPGEFLPIAFSVWDGFSRERGNRRGLSLWYSLYLEPENVPSPIGPMITTALVILGIELAIVGWVRRSRSRPREDLGGERTQQPAASV